MPPPPPPSDLGKKEEDFNAAVATTTTYETSASGSINDEKVRVEYLERGVEVMEPAEGDNIVHIVGICTMFLKIKPIGLKIVNLISFFHKKSRQL